MREKPPTKYDGRHNFGLLLLFYCHRLIDLYNNNNYSKKCVSFLQPKNYHIHINIYMLLHMYILYSTNPHAKKGRL
jgi:hypothetical protein